MNPVASRVSQELREKILRGFEAWLDGALAGEESPKGIAPELLAGLENGGLLPPIEGHCAGPIAPCTKLLKVTIEG